MHTAINLASQIPTHAASNFKLNNLLKHAGYKQIRTYREMENQRASENRARIEGSNRKEIENYRRTLWLCETKEVEEKFSLFLFSFELIPLASLFSLQGEELQILRGRQTFNLFLFSFTFYAKWQITLVVFI